MAYTRTQWVSHDTWVTADRMNNIEGGIVNNETAASNAQNTADKGVRYTNDQSLTDEQKAQARENIAAANISVNQHIMVVNIGIPSESE